MRTIIWPYGPSTGARLLSNQLDTIRVRTNGNYQPRQSHAVINWGNSENAPWFRNSRGIVFTICNTPASVAVASNKLLTFQAFRRDGVPHPEWTTNILEARRWIENEKKVFCRALLRASEGRGIVLAERVEQLIHAPLYVKHFPKETEFRVHVFRGEVIDVAQKRLRNGERDNPTRNRYIRNHENGWVFAHENVRVPEQAREAALRAVRSVGLDFGAVDLAVNRRGEVSVFETNTAPGIEGQTVNKYAEAIRRFCND